LKKYGYKAKIDIREAKKIFGEKKALTGINIHKVRKL
jgi:hypothetical protein